MPQRFYCENLNKTTVKLDPTESHHLIKVRRLSVNETVELFDGRGTIATAVISDLNKKNVTLKIRNRSSKKPRTQNRVIIASSIAKASRFDDLITKCTELGIDRVTPVIYERTVKLSTNPDIINRFDNLSISAAKQSHTNFLPKIDLPLKLSSAIESLKKDFPAALIIFGSLDQNTPSIISLQQTTEDIIVFIGPEGGFTDEEIEMLKKADAQPVKLTDTVLRIETAAIAFAAVLATIRNAQAC